MEKIMALQVKIQYLALLQPQVADLDIEVA
jgi:hypothetical protein